MKSEVRFVLALSSFLLLGAAAPALAAPTEVGDLATKTVRFSRAEISTGAGAELLYGRIAAAARFVCRGAPAAAVRECRSRAIADAVRAVGSPLVSSIHRSAVERVEEVVLR